MLNMMQTWSVRARVCGTCFICCYGMRWRSRLMRTTRRYFCSATKGVGRVQPTEWEDCAGSLRNPELKGVQMPKGKGKDFSPPGAYLQYNEVNTCTSPEHVTD